MDSREFKFIFVGVAFVVLLDGAIIPAWWDWLKLFYSSSKACKSIVGDAIRWRFLNFFCHALLLKGRIFIKDAEVLQLLKFVNM
jgi:hypothetical protein